MPLVFDATLPDGTKFHREMADDVFESLETYRKMQTILAPATPGGPPVRQLKYPDFMSMFNGIFIANWADPAFRNSPPASLLVQTAALAAQKASIDQELATIVQTALQNALADPTVSGS